MVLNAMMCLYSVCITFSRRVPLLCSNFTSKQLTLFSQLTASRPYLVVVGERLPMEDFLATVLPRPADAGGYSGAVTPYLFCVPQILLRSEKFVLNI